MATAKLWLPRFGSHSCDLSQPVVPDARENALSKFQDSIQTPEKSHNSLHGTSYAIIQDCQTRNFVAFVAKERLAMSNESISETREILDFPKLMADEDMLLDSWMGAEEELPF